MFGCVKTDEVPPCKKENYDKCPALRSLKVEFDTLEGEMLDLWRAKDGEDVEDAEWFLKRAEKVIAWALLGSPALRSVWRRVVEEFQEGKREVLRRLRSVLTFKEEVV